MMEFPPYTWAIQIETGDQD
uniref:Uncharacterized protein n=1 Tax=Arundo donax TaxID=35708 RepID=A0A0A8ZL45_ARUDO